MWQRLPGRMEKCSLRGQKPDASTNHRVFKEQQTAAIKKVVENVTYFFIVWSSWVTCAKCVAHNYVPSPFCKNQCLDMLGYLA